MVVGGGGLSRGNRRGRLDLRHSLRGLNIDVVSRLVLDLHC